MAAIFPGSGSEKCIDSKDCLHGSDGGAQYSGLVTVGRLQTMLVVDTMGCCGW